MADYAFDRAAALVPIFEAELLALPDELKAKIYDIRLKAGQALTVCGRDGIFFLCGNGRVTKNPRNDAILCGTDIMEEIFLRLCNYSVFSHENEISKGFITMQSAYRVGICGSAVEEKGKIKSIRDISSMVFRIPREKDGCARQLFTSNIDFAKGILIAGEPSSGKTTFLRDIVKSLSFGTYSRAKRTAVLDERCELESIFDLGPCADVFKSYPKSEGLTMALRSMSPEIMVCDELSPRDQNQLEQAMYCGVPVIASVHACEADLLYRDGIYHMLESGLFGTVVFLSGREDPGHIKSIVKAGELLERHRRGYDYSERSYNRPHTNAKAENSETVVA